MEKQQQRLFTAIDEIRQMLKEVHFTTVNASLPQCREELAEMKKQQQLLYRVIDEIRQMVKEVPSTTFNVSSQMLKENHSTTVNVSCRQCPGGFLHRNSTLGSCYFISKKKLSWNEAAEDCIHRGSYLAEIQSEEESDYLNTLLVADTIHWIGGNDIVT